MDDELVHPHVRRHVSAVFTLAASAALARAGQFVGFIIFAGSASVSEVASLLTALTVITIAEFLGDGGTRVRASREWSLEQDPRRREIAVVRLTRSRDRTSLMFIVAGALISFVFSSDVAAVVALGIPLAITFNRIQLWTVIGQSSNRWSAVAAVETITGAGSLAAFLAFRAVTGDMIALILGLDIAYLVGAIVGRRLFIRNGLAVVMPTLRESIATYRQSADISSVQLLELLFIRFDLVIVASVSSVRVTAAYGVASKIAESTRSMTVHLTTVARTALQTAAKREGSPPSEAELGRWFGVVAGGTFAATIVVVLAVSKLTGVFGEVDPSTTLVMTTILLTAEIPLLCQSLLQYVQIGVVKDRRLALAPAIYALLTYGGALAAGLLAGLAAAPAIASLVAYFVSFTLYARRESKSLRRQILRTTLGATLASAVFGGGMIWALS